MGSRTGATLTGLTVQSMVVVSVPPLLVVDGEVDGVGRAGGGGLGDGAGDLAGGRVDGEPVGQAGGRVDEDVAVSVSVASTSTRTVSPSSLV